MAAGGLVGEHARTTPPRAPPPGGKWRETGKESGNWKRWWGGVNAHGAIRRPFEPGGKPGLFMFGRLPRLRRR